MELGKINVQDFTTEISAIRMHCKLKDIEQISVFLQSFDQHHGTIQTLSNPYYKDNDKYMIKLSGSRISQLMPPIDVIPLRLLLSSSPLFSL